MAIHSKTLKGTFLFLILLISFPVFGTTNGRLLAKVSSQEIDVSKLKECPESDNQKGFPDPDKCGGYYSCSYSPEYSKYLLHPLICSKNTAFDEKTHRCSETELCPETIPELTLPSGWRCDENGFKNADPSDCRQYYTCNDCKSPENLARKCYTSDKCADTEYFDNFKMDCVPSTICPQDRLGLPKDEQWPCEENDELHQSPTNCSEYYSCHRCSSSCRGWCYEMHQCSPEDYHFDETQKKCVSEGECKLMPTEPPRLPPIVENQKCERLQRRNRWPDESNCHCYYECTRIFIPFLPYMYKYKQKCCDGGSYDPIGKKCSEEKCCNLLSTRNVAKTYYAYKNLVMTNKVSE